MKCLTFVLLLYLFVQCSPRPRIDAAYLRLYIDSKKDIKKRYGKPDIMECGKDITCQWTYSKDSIRLYFMGDQLTLVRLLDAKSTRELNEKTLKYMFDYLLKQNRDTTHKVRPTTDSIKEFILNDYIGPK